MFGERIAIRHAGDIIADETSAALLVAFGDQRRRLLPIPRA